MSAVEKIRRALDGMPEADEVGVPGLSSLRNDRITEVQAAEIANLLRAARRAGKAEEAQARRSRREGRKRDPDQLGADTQRMVVSGLGKRAATDLDALTALQGLFDSERDVMAMAVDGLRTHHSDTEIGIALGLQPEYARQEVGRRFGRRGTPEDAESDSAVAEGPTQ